MEVFGDETDHGHNWKIIHYLFLFPYTVVDEEGVVSQFADFYASTFDGIEGDVDINTTDGDFHLNGTIYGEFVESYIEMDCYLGLREKFVYKKRKYGEEFTTIINMTMIDIYIPDPRPEIPGYTYIMGTGIVCVCVITILVQRKISRGKTKKA